MTMTLRYVLRLNDHAGDHGRLLRDAVRPAVERARARYGAFPVAVRPHWLDGPHVRLAVAAGEPDRMAGICAMLTQEIGGWLAARPPFPAIDRRAYEEKSRRLAALEELVYEPRPLRPDRTVEREPFEPPYPLGDRRLADLRDTFKARSLPDIYDLIDQRLACATVALAEFAVRICCLHHLAWRDGAAIWPLSLRAQAIVSVKSFPGVSRDFPAAFHTIKPLLITAVRERGIFGPDPGLSAGDRTWIATLQESYDDLLAFVDRADAAFFVAMRGDIAHARAFSEQFPEVTAERLHHLLGHPVHFAYRMMMNMLYDMLPAIGFTARDRFLVCYAVTRFLEEDHRSVLAQAKIAGARMWPE